MFHASVSQRENVFHDKKLYENENNLSGYGLITWGKEKAMILIDTFSCWRPSIMNSKSELIHTLKETKLELCLEIDCYIIQTTFILFWDSIMSRINALKKLPDF